MSEYEELPNEEEATNGLEEMEFESPLSGADVMFVALNEDFQSAVRSGFTEKQAFDLIKILWSNRVAFSLYTSSPHNEPEK